MDNIRSNDIEVIIMSMVFGRGTRLSPFTQSLGNVKPRFPTPYFSKNINDFLNIAELSNMYSNLIVNHLSSGGFNGVVIKWGDEIMIPGINWDSIHATYENIDAFRFVWFTNPTPDLAREKEWILVNKTSNRMEFQLARQDINRLLERAKLKSKNHAFKFGVNLGSLAISKDLLNIFSEIFSDSIMDSRLKIDWDPYVWIALSCKNHIEWNEELRHEKLNGFHGIAQLESKCPDFYSKIKQVKKKFESIKGREINIQALDFGDVLWIDFGQHFALRKNLNLLVNETERKNISREIFGLPLNHDANGNTIINSDIHINAKISDSLIINSSIGGDNSKIRNGVIVNSNLNKVSMPYGGIALFCSTSNIDFNGPNAIAFNSIDQVINLPQGGRHTTVISKDRAIQLISNENIINYNGENFSTPVQGNEISFEHASNIVRNTNIEFLDRRRDLLRTKFEKRK